MPEDTSSEDLEKLVSQAKVVAEATGRDEAEVLADLLDDGIVNLSNVKDDDKDLVTQLKEAAELINTVQNINQEVSENTVLNGGDNKTKVKVETTLEGDIVDRAIASVERKAEKIRKIAIIMAPILLLLSGGVGLDYFLEDGGDGSSSEDYLMEIWGCTASDAENFMPEATNDDGSCYWDNEGGNGPGPPNCDWSWEDNSYLDNENFLVIRATFSDNSCPHEMEGRFTVELLKDGEYYDEDEWENIKFKNTYELQHSFSDLEAGVYRNHFFFETYDGSNWNWDSSETHEVFDDTCYPQTELDEPMLTTEGNDLVVDLVFSDMGGCGQDIEIEMEIWNGGQLHDNLDYGEVHFGVFWIEPVGDSTMRVQGKAQLSDLPDGDDWVVKVRYAHANADEAPYESAWYESNSIVIDEVDDNIYGCTDTEATNYDSMATSDDGSCEYPPDEPCDVEIINHYRGHVAEDEEQDAILVAFRVEPNEGCEEGVEIDLFLKQPGQPVNYSTSWELSDPSQPEDFTHTFDGVAVGDSWIPIVTAYDMENDSVVESIMMWGIDVEEQEPELCEINLFWVAIGTNSTHATVGYDLDCGYENNDLEGYNVSVQFLVYEVNGTSGGPNATGPIIYDTRLHYIEGWVEDNHYITLTNFTSSNATHYDFYFYAIWVDGEGESQMIEEKWLNREINA